MGTILDAEFHQSDAGGMLDRLWKTMPERYPGASIDSYCLMPNHFHAIVGIGLEDDAHPPFPSISVIMNWFKSATTVEYIRGVRGLGWPRFHKHLWLEGYHDHIIRTDSDLDRIRDYIEANAATWKHDSLYWI